jgi:hypothetical protein
VSQFPINSLHRLLQITFTTSDAQTFKVDEEVAKKFGTVRLMLEGDPAPPPCQQQQKPLCQLLTQHCLCAVLAVLAYRAEELSDDAVFPLGNVKGSTLAKVSNSTSTSRRLVGSLQQAVPWQPLHVMILQQLHVPATLL